MTEVVEKEAVTGSRPWPEESRAEGAPKAPGRWAAAFTMLNDFAHDTLTGCWVGTALILALVSRRLGPGGSLERLREALAPVLQELLP